MRAAPAVSVQAGRSPGWLFFQSAVTALAVTALAAWVLAHLQQPAWPALALGPLAAALAWRVFRRPPVALLWNGLVWSADGQNGTLEVMIDLGGWLLLRLRPDDASGRALWMPVSRGDAGPSFHGLRAAVYCRASEPTPGVRPAREGSRVAPPD
jgi:hypothetical protein